MIPRTVSAVTMLVALVPGYVFLQLTRGLREARDSSPLESLIELVSVGLGTTGIAFLAGCLLRSSSIAFIVTRVESNSWDATLIHDMAGTAGLMLVAAVALAIVAAMLLRLTLPRRYYPRAWKEVFAERRDEYTWIRLELDDGRAVVGPLHASDYRVEEGERDMVLRSPITEIDVEGKHTDLLGIHRLVTPESQISAIKVVYAPRPLRRKSRFAWIRKSSST